MPSTLNIFIVQVPSELMKDTHFPFYINYFTVNSKWKILLLEMRGYDNVFMSNVPHKY